MQYESRISLSFADFRKLKCLKVENRVEYLSLNTMFNVYHKTAPEYLCDIDLISHGHNTRNSSQSFIIPHVKTQGSKSFRYNGIRLWNSLPSYLKNIEEKRLFKCKCKDYLMKKMYNEEVSEFVYL